MSERSRLVAAVFEVSDRAMELYHRGFGLDLHVRDHQGDDRWTSGRNAAASWTNGAFIHFALYESKDGRTTAGTQVTFQVDDLDEAHRRAVAAAAVVVHEPKPQPWGRSARYGDADGNTVEPTEAPR